MEIQTSSIAYLADGTVDFLPVRLNRQPIVVLGLTSDEMFITAGISAVTGLLAGIFVASLMGELAMVPTMVVAFITLGIFMGGRFFRKIKRNRPETWLYRQLQWRAVEQFPFLTTWVGGDDLIKRSGLWSHRREEFL
ncbi:MULTISPECIES: TIGR03750 family conjugal transfer protein [Pseudomonas syringae group genomosp. 2]|uniref:Uncharacterized protein n=1 Tax=Pseudomonas amygdali pv. ulmi TaxID=251720 RepID=A0A0Q0DVV1_PSEA0|nr:MULTISPECIES: TIGR03750 family conjugal transfer protein [Pseudomonas syringae group genomosp. 2]KPX40527.1 hypothetical protein ALO69_200010 [Pseudomonas ficuserectae]KPZ12416.1 hypothetical protein ALO41_200156 [Pseudomonas amygdali pv. ulmi]KWS16865.1 conjugal transfer protein [Pseudomonas amygdali pv. ulmi]PAB26724.1 TIGR03750 family conjugal transfer protein [Pseudomonas savastanoi pv. fraxini]RMS37767.1 hypothetical protein ALP68_200173 [Pseudomonas ficuserectae]